MNRQALALELANVYAEMARRERTVLQAIVDGLSRYVQPTPSSTKIYVLLWLGDKVVTRMVPPHADSDTTKPKTRFKGCLARKRSWSEDMSRAKSWENELDELNGTPSASGAVQTVLRPVSILPREPVQATEQPSTAINPPLPRFYRRYRITLSDELMALLKAGGRITKITLPPYQPPSADKS